MKRKVLLFMIVVLGMSGCRNERPIYNAVGIGDDANTITVRCNGYGKTEGDAIADAGLYTIEQVLFRGVPNSNQREPLIGVDEDRAWRNHRGYLESLLTNKRYLSFLTLTSPIEGGRERRQNWVVVDVTVNLRALRSDLEQAGVIRKFGY